MSGSNIKDGMRYPSIDQLIEITNSKYQLVVGVAKRARELNKQTENAAPLIDNPHSKKSIGIALEEVFERKIRIVDLKNDEISKDRAPRNDVLNNLISVDVYDDKI